MQAYPWLSKLCGTSLNGGHTLSLTRGWNRVKMAAKIWYGLAHRLTWHESERIQQCLCVTRVVQCLTFEIGATLVQFPIPESVPQLVMGVCIVKNG